LKAETAALTITDIINLEYNLKKRFGKKMKEKGFFIEKIIQQEGEIIACWNKDKSGAGWIK